MQSIKNKVFADPGGALSVKYAQVNVIQWQIRISSLCHHNRLCFQKERCHI
jgi:hypothetical protein